jgi:hypothetical protein
VARVPRKVTIAEASELTGLSRKALARRVERGALSATTENGLRYLDSRELARAGLLDLSTGKPAKWTGRRIDPDAVARELVRTLTEQSVELYELRDELDAHSEQLRQARREREAIRDELAQAKRERAELRQQIEQRPKRRRA